jgi:shikimate dehydrogenase
VAEREGFEPSEEETPFNGLANRRTRPLCDLSEDGADDSMGTSGDGLPARSAPPNHDPDQLFERPVQRLPVIGQTVTSSAFEAVQRAAIEAAGLALEIERWERRPHQLAGAIEQLHAEEFAGALVVAPHKEKAAGLVDALSEDARHTGAVNLIVPDGTRLRGHNTDVDGLRAGLAALLPAAQASWPRQAVVLGAGGGARAAVSVLLGSGFQRIVVFNRHLYRAEGLVAHFARSARQVDLRALPWHETVLEAELGRTGLLVNSSGVGVDEGATPIPAELLPDGLIVLDLVLNHEVTPLMREVQQRGGTVANGQGTFLASSAETFTLLTRRDAPADVMRAALAAELGLPEETIAVVGD